MNKLTYCLLALIFLSSCGGEETKPPTPSGSVEGRLLCASNLAYEINSAGKLNPAEIWMNGAGFTEAPRVLVAGPDNIHACIIGKNSDGIVIAFRGTLPPDQITMQVFSDWVNNVLLMPPAEFEGLSGKIHEGFATAVQSLWPQIEKALEEFQVNGETKIYVTGHSKGGAMAVLATSLLQNKKGWKVKALVTFGAPRCGDKTFAETLKEIPYRRFENAGDLVPLLPPDFAFITVTSSIPGIGEKLARAKDWEFEGAGELIYIREDLQQTGSSLMLALERGQDIFQILLKPEEGPAQLLKAHGCGCGSAYQKAIAPDVKCAEPAK